MSLDETRILYALEMIGVMPGTVVYATDQLGLNVVTIRALNGPQPAVTAARALIAAWSPEQLAIATAIIDAYSALRLITPGIVVAGGSFGGVSGATVDFESMKNEYKKMLKQYLPFWENFQSMQQMREQQSQTIARVMM